MLIIDNCTIECKKGLNDKSFERNVKYFLYLDHCKIVNKC